MRSLITVPAILIYIFFPVAGSAVNISVQDCSQEKVQAAVDSSVNGDTISIPGGSCVWSKSLSIPSSKGIILNGNGADISGQIVLNQNDQISSRITGFRFVSQKSILVHGAKTSAPFRIDNNNFTINTQGATFIEVSGNAPGLIDHNRFFAPQNAEMIHNLGMGPTDASGWTEEVTPGSSNAVYIENNTFTNNDLSGNPAYFWGNSAVQSYYGAKTVFRYNYLTMSHVDQHGTPGMIGARWWEIYENTFNVVPYGNQSSYVVVRAGSGVIFKNHKTGSENLGGGTISLLEEDPEYPALYQIGRGKNQTLDPAYVWENDTQMNVGSGSSNVQEGRDYYQTIKPNYVPYPYPYPLTFNGLPNMHAGSSSPPLLILASPKNLRVL